MINELEPEAFGMTLMHAARAATSIPPDANPTTVNARIINGYSVLWKGI
jgi:hypothetical protein